MTSYFRSLCCNRRSSKDCDGGPRIKSIRRMDVQKIMDYMEKCATMDLDETIWTCRKIMTNPNKLSAEHKLAIMRCLFTIIKNRKVVGYQVLIVSDTVDYILKHPKHFGELENMALSLDVELAKQIPIPVASRIVNLFGLPSIPYEEVFLALQSLICSHAKTIIPHILATIVPLMKMENTTSQKYWFSRVMEILALNLPSRVDESLRHLYSEGYFTCKLYYVQCIPGLNSAESQLCEQVLTTLGKLVNILTVDDLSFEVPWVAEEIRRLQYSTHLDISFDTFDLIKPLGLFIKAAQAKECMELEAALPTLLAALHHNICMPSSEISKKRKGSVKIAKGLILSLARDHPSAVFRYIEKSLIQSDEYSRYKTMTLLHELIKETDLESTHWQDTVLRTLQDNDHKVILEVLNIIDVLTAKGCCVQIENNVIEYLLKQTRQSITAEEDGCIDIFEEVYKDQIRSESFLILNRISFNQNKSTEEDGCIDIFEEVYKYQIRSKSFQMFNRIAFNQKKSTEVFRTEIMKGNFKGGNPEAVSDLRQNSDKANNDEIQNFSNTIDEEPESSGDEDKTISKESLGEMSLEVTNVRQFEEPMATSDLESPMVPKSSLLSTERRSWLKSNPTKVRFNAKILLNGEEKYSYKIIIN